MNGECVRMTGNSRRIAALTTVIAGCLAAWEAQPQGFGRPESLSLETRETVWKLQADETAGSLDLSKEDRDKLVGIYVANRRNLQEQLEATDADERSGPAYVSEYTKLVQQERDKFKTSLLEFLNEEQIEKAVATLGTFSRSWDRLILAWEALDLEPEKSKQGHAMIAAYIADSEKLRADAPVDGDADALRDSVEELKIGLNLSLATLLSEEQQTQWERSTRSRSGGALQSGSRRRYR